MPVLITVVLIWLIAAVPAFAAGSPAFPALSGRVVDQARLLSPDREAELDGTLAALERDTGNQVVVVTVNSLEGLEIEDYGYRLGRAWGIGRRDSNNGVLLIVAPEERRVRIEVGYGLEPVLTDALSALIIQNQILPSFRTGGYEAGITRGVAAIDTQLRLDPVEAQAVAAEAAAPRNDLPVRTILVIGVVFLLLLFSLIGAASAGGRRRRGGDGLTPILIWAAAEALKGSARGGRGGGFGGGGGFSGGGGSFGGGGASGGW
ncbi:TPM domain-containing protein [uncultured Brevundimonas sp.]|uniref:TPM domain-containing protein n=1 Tax=uncultured Brevundimonas sp. TaxID=213418 RepID=UPI0030EC5076|tara:strand:+ start:3580 stop:4365 length:786 start_codon:yes stop_codon:yes gene_type:complete